MTEFSFPYVKELPLGGFTEAHHEVLNYITFTITHMIVRTWIHKTQEDCFTDLDEWDHACTFVVAGLQMHGSDDCSLGLCP